MSRLTLSIHTLRTDSRGKPTLLRALLWKGYLTWHVDSIIWTGTWDHPNLFKNLSGLKNAVREELEWRGGMWKNILGIHTADPCWPLDPSMALSSDIMALDNEELVEVVAMRPLAHCGGYKGLSCLVVPETETDPTAASSRTLLYELPPLPPREHVRASLVSFACFGINLFQVTGRLRSAVLECALERKLSDVYGLYRSSAAGAVYSEDACWPEGLGEIRFS